MLWIGSLAGVQAAPTQSKQLPLVPKWGRFERVFQSKTGYANPLQDVALTVSFISPEGETNQVSGFWDGGRVWRVRFRPSQVGHWSFRTACSDPANRGLHNQTGEFICTAPLGENRFQRHGPIRVAMDRRHFEHEDGTPFFWLADNVGAGARKAGPADWEFYVRARAAQGFTVAKWSLGLEPGLNMETAVRLAQGRIEIDPVLFQSLDDRIADLSRAGILSAIAPLTDLSKLGDEQAALVMRYAIARWSADAVTWLLTPGTNAAAENLLRWQRIGHAVFFPVAHAPVLWSCRDSPTADKLRQELWIDAFEVTVGTGLIPEQSAVTLAKNWIKAAQQEPPRPWVINTPSENHLMGGSGQRFQADDVRRSAYWGLTMVSMAGVSYGAEGVIDWSTARDGAELPLWQRSLFLPGAKEMAYLAKLINSLEFWRLRPQPQALAAQPGDSAPERWIAADRTESGDLSLIYVPEDRTVEVLLDALPSSPNVMWLNPRDGQNSPAVAVVGGRSCQFPTPDPGDWVLILRAGK